MTADEAAIAALADAPAIELGAVLLRGTRIGDVALTFSADDEAAAVDAWPTAVVVRPVELVELRRLAADPALAAAFRLALAAKQAGASIRANKPTARTEPGVWLEYR